MYGVTEIERVKSQLLVLFNASFDQPDASSRGWQPRGHCGKISKIGKECGSAQTLFFVGLFGRVTRGIANSKT